MSDERMRVLVVTNQYPRPGHPTMAQFNRQQFRALNADHDVSLIVPMAWTEAIRARLKVGPLPARVVNADGMTVQHPIYYYPPKILQHHYGDFYARSIRAAFSRAVAEFAPNVVLASFAHPDGWAAVRLAHESGLPAVVKLVGSDVLVAGRSALRRPRVAEALREADYLVAVSRDLADHAIAMGADPAKIDIIPEGIDRELFRPLDRAECRGRLGLALDVPMILFVGNILLSKGAGVLVEACARLRDTGRRFRCDLVGLGRDEAKVRSLVARHDLGGVVTLAGARPLSDLPDWYGASDVVTLPSYSEGIPNVLREALACGRPIVATRVGGIPEIADARTSVLVAPGSASALADALGSVLDGAVAGGGGGGTLSWDESARLLAGTLRRAIRNRAGGGSIGGRGPDEPTPSSNAWRSMSGPPEPTEETDGPSLRILILTRHYPRPGHESNNQFNRQQFRAMARHHSLCLISPVSWTEEIRDRMAGRRTPERHVNSDGISVYHPIYYYPPKFLQASYGECYMASVRLVFEHAVKEFRPNVVLGCFAHPDGWAAVTLAREFGLASVIKCHGSDVLISGRRGPRRLRVAEALRQADGIVAVSRDLADHILRMGGDSSRLAVVHNGIDRELFRPLDRAECRGRLGLALDVPMILFVGNILLSKGAGVLVEACARLRDTGRRFRCDLVGLGRDEAKVRSLVARHDLGGVVTLAGARPLSDLPDWYGASDVVTLPSYSEGIPNVLREALACGRPIVATRVGGIPEIADARTSVLVAPGSASALADALGSVLDGAVAGGGGGGTLSWDESAQRLIGLLRRAIRHHADVAGTTLPAASGPERVAP